MNLRTLAIALIVLPALVYSSDPAGLPVPPQGFDARNGDIVVALLDEEATVKTYAASKGRVMLKPENPDYEAIVLSRKDDVRILGKVVGLLRRF